MENREILKSSFKSWPDVDLDFMLYIQCLDKGRKGDDIGAERERERIKKFRKTSFSLILTLILIRVKYYSKVNYLLSLKGGVSRLI